MLALAGVCILCILCVVRSAVDSLKAALLCSEITAATAGCPSFASACRAPTGPSSQNEGGANGGKTTETDGGCSRIPLYVEASLEWEELGIYLHHLDDSTEGQERIDRKTASFSGLAQETVNAEDALHLHAKQVSAHFNNRNCGTVCRLEMKQLLLEQPSLPEESVNRYIVRVPPLDHFSASKYVASEFPGGASIQLVFTSGTCSASGANAASITTFVHVLRPMTLNFRPTPLIWAVNFLKEPFGSCVSSGGRNTAGNKSGTCTDGESSSSLYEAHSQRKKISGDAPQLEARAEAALKTGKLELDPTTPPHAGEVSAEASGSWVQGDPVLREVRVDLQTVDFLWSTRGSDRPLATASVSAASVSLQLRRYSTKITGSVKDLKLHFVTSSMRSVKTAIRSSGCRRECRAQVQLKQAPWEVPLELCADKHLVHNRLTKTAILQTTEIIGLVPGRSYVVSFSLESVHPLSPQFCGLSSNLKVDVGTCRVVYIHPKFWRLFDWMIDDFIGTLTSSQSSAVSPPQKARLGSISASQEVPTKRIERSPSLEDLAIRSVLQSAASVAMPTSPPSVHSNEREFTSEGLVHRSSKKQPLLVPNEGLRRIFLLADAGRSILGLSPLFQERQLGPSGNSGGDSELHRLVLPQSLPFSVLHYEIRIASPRLLLPAGCRPNSRVILWPPVGCTKRESYGCRVACDGSCRTTSTAVGGGVATCKKCIDYLAASASSTHAGAREILCLLDSFTVSNSWRLSRGHGIVESINVEFKGAKAFAKIDEFSQSLNKSCSKPAPAPVDIHRRKGFEAPYWGGTCRRCARRVPWFARSSTGGSCSSPASAASGDSDATATTDCGRYLFGGADIVFHMFRPVLRLCSSRWLRVEAGLLPVILDVQTLRLLFDIVENNITANDPDTAVENAEALLPACSPTPCSGGLHAMHVKRGTEEPSASRSDASFPMHSPVPNGAFGIAPHNLEEDLRGLVQTMLGNHRLQGLLEPQVDFIELLEEWGHETLLLELVVEGLQLALREQPLKKEIRKLRKKCGALRRCIRALERRQGLWPNESNSSQFPAQEGGSRVLALDGLRKACVPQREPFLLFHATRLRVRYAIVYVVLNCPHLIRSEELQKLLLLPCLQTGHLLFVLRLTLSTE